MQPWGRDFHIFLRTQHPEILDDIRNTRDLSKDNEQALVRAIEHYAGGFGPVIDEHGLHLAHDWTFNPKMGVAPLLGVARAAAPLVESTLTE